MSKILNVLLDQTKELAKETLQEITTDVGDLIKNKVKEKVNDNVNKIINPQYCKIESKSVKESLELLSHKQEDNIYDNELSENETIYMDLVNKKLKDGNIPEVSKYFLKLNREKLGISEKRAKELELSVINKV